MRPNSPATSGRPAGGVREPYTTAVRSKRRMWIIIAAVALVVIAIPAVWALRIANTIAGSRGIGGVFKALTDPRKLFPGKDRLIVLVLGKDYNRDRKGMPYTKGSRADTIMLLNVDLLHPALKAVSIPRDSKVTGADGITDKVNSIMSRGGPELMMQTLNQAWGVNPDYYVVLKPDAVRKIVDELGGVDVETVDEMNYDDSWGQLHIHLPKGKVHVNGAEAEGFVRFRKSSPSARRHHKGGNLEEGDLRRAARQQQLIHAMVLAGLKPANIAQADSVIETGFKQVETNLQKDQLVALANIFRQAGTADIQSGTLPGEDSMEHGVYYWVLDELRSRRMIAWLIQGDEFSGRGLPRIVVFNGSKVNGAARTAASMLYAEGYEPVSRAAKAAPASMITFRSALFLPQAQQLGQRLGIQQISKEQSDPRDTWSPDIKITIGPDIAEKFAPAPGTVVSDSTPRRKRSKPATPPAPDVSIESEPGSEATPPTDEQIQFESSVPQ